MIFGFLEARPQKKNEQLLKLYWNRAAVKRELRDLRRERYELLDKLKEQEAAIARAREQLEGLERLLTNPLAAANAMVYFQLRYLWDTAAQRLEQFASDLELQREKRERRQLREAELAKRGRRLQAIAEKLTELEHKRAGLESEKRRLDQRLKRSNFFMKLLNGPKLKRRIRGLVKGEAVLAQRIDELKDLVTKIEGEPLPELEGLSVESRRLINTALIALAQHFVVHFAEHDLAVLAKATTERAVADMKFGDRRDCDRMVERIREKLNELKQQNFAEKVRRRTELLMPQLRYRNETDAVPIAECVDEIPVNLDGDQPARRASDAPIRINVLAGDYWDLLSALR